MKLDIGPGSEMERRLSRPMYNRKCGPKPIMDALGTKMVEKEADELGIPLASGTMNRSDGSESGSRNGKTVFFEPDMHVLPGPPTHQKLSSGDTPCGKWPHEAVANWEDERAGNLEVDNYRDLWTWFGSCPRHD